ncbi:hypothetical protein [Streptomyces fulvoviolaceus]|uniref:hypothetical protein n=1 Tax=Streptomyces fulvoviolaceus TaxID=285535 RepID=UPI0021BFAE29|nr:hypothetical protein [Streptomyces fulvoviolaceus]MCT9075282.1 hypothetical protein [Streptomyces fulvoviolaceus]
MAALVLGALAGCSDTSGGKADPTAGATHKAAAPVRLPVPDGFATETGWSTSASPEATDIEPGSSGFPLVAVAPKSGLVIQAAADGSRVRAFSLASGKAAWTFTPKALTGLRAGVFVQESKAGEKVVLARQGKTSGSGLSTSRRTTTIDVIAADSASKATAAHHLDLATPDDTATSFTATDSGILVGVTDGVHEKAVEIDPATGAKRTVQKTSVTVSGCASGSCAVQASPAFATSQGVVSAFQQQDGCDPWAEDGTPCTYGFQVGDAWTSTNAAPSGMHVGIPLAVTGPYLVAAWHTSDTQTDPPALSDSKKTILALHDLSTGKIKAQVSCTSADALTLQPGSAQSSTRLSPNGDFLVSGQVGFDLATGRGRCFTSTASTKGIDLTAVDDDGTAYGIVHVVDDTEATSLYGRLPIAQDGTDTPEHDSARVSLRSGTAKALPAASEVPLYVASDGHGVFRTRDVVAVYPAS